VPLFSFLALRGKCRYCGARISWRYFVIEFVTGLLFTACWLSVALRYPDEIFYSPAMLGMVVMACIFAAAMLVTFMIDLDTTLVFEPITWIAAGAGIGYELLDKAVNIQPIAYTIAGIKLPYVPAAIPGMLLGFVIFLLMDLFGRLIFRKPSMGLGDSFIGAAIGAMLGPGLALLSFAAAVFLAAIIGVVLMLTGTLKRSTAPGAEETRAAGSTEDLPQGIYMPFGPFLTGSALIIALAPQWWALHAAQWWHWWLYQNPFMG
jgi:leader peptidase (prepilin peptidase)/N-methyltransferase